MRILKLFGVELEGGWDIEPPRGDRWKDDGSVNVRGTWRVGEIVSEPMRSVKAGMKFIKENYPQHVGGTCGLHVHMSFEFNEQCIAILADSRDYQDKLLSNLKKLGEKLNVRNQHFWTRLEGQNTFCRTTFDGNGIFDRDRYRVVNFCAYQRHKTVEIRVLPMFQTDKLAQRFVRRILAFTNNYLAKKLFSEPTFDIDQKIEVVTNSEAANPFLFTENISREILV